LETHLPPLLLLEPILVSVAPILLLPLLHCTGWRRVIGRLILIGHFPQKSPIISGSFAKNDLQLGARQALAPEPPRATGVGPEILQVMYPRTLIFLFFFRNRTSETCDLKSDVSDLRKSVSVLLDGIQMGRLILGDVRFQMGRLILGDVRFQMGRLILGDVRFQMGRLILGDVRFPSC